MKELLLCVLAVLLALLGLGRDALCANQGPSLPTLWSVGQEDNDTAEFALAPGDYRGYRDPGCFVVGASDARRDWPYVQPGTADGSWAPGTPQTFEVWFGLRRAPRGDCRLVLDLVDTHGTHPPTLRVQINRASWDCKTPAGAGDASVFGEPGKGREHKITLDVPVSALIDGDNHIAITNVEGSWLLWDALRFDAPAGTKVVPIRSRTHITESPASARPAILRTPKGPAQQLAIRIRHLGEELDATLQVADAEPIPVRLHAGVQLVQTHANPVEIARDVQVTLRAEGTVLARTAVHLAPVQHREIHLIHQTHLDIGYTHTQDVVLHKQIDYLRDAMRYIEETKDYPEGARFVWHPEGMWAVDEFLRTATAEEKGQFTKVCLDKSIHLDVLYAQAMTGMYTEEELFELMRAAKRFETNYGGYIDSAMQSDVPGYTWGLAAALAHHGVNFMSIGPNHFHRMGYTFDWGDRPFWWQSPSGKHRVLFWMCGDGYAYFHGRKLDEHSVFGYLAGLQRKGYPYEMTLMRYCIGGDNGPPDRQLCDFVRDWNERYITPTLVIAKNSEALKEFARRYGDELEVHRGDFTPYWEDGSASTALATGTNRRACERIVQAQTLWALCAPDLPLHEAFDEAWTKMIMYDEHTWGAHNSISQPDGEFARQQDAYKQAFAFDGATMTEDLLEQVTGAAEHGTSNTFAVYNTLSWERTGLVVLPPEESKAGDRVLAPDGQPVPSQRLASGELAVLAEDVPALGARSYTIEPGTPHAIGNARAEGLVIANDRLRAEVDPKTGALRSLRDATLDRELVDPRSGTGLNGYLYILGRDPEQNRQTVEGEVTVRVEDPGPLVATLRIESDAPGCRRLTRRVRLVHGLDHLELHNTTDKLRERRPEGLYFDFPFDVPDARAKVDVPWAVVEVEKDQLPGANRNYYCVQRFVDLSNADFGVTWVPIDAPMVQFDPIVIAHAGGTQWWRTHIDPNAYLHSWTMNNHWETNYKADQEGILSFAYAIQVHAGGYEPIAAQRFGRERCQPLLAISTDADSRLPAPLVEVDDPGAVITSIRPIHDGETLMVRLFNVAGHPVRTKPRWASRINGYWLANPMGEPIGPHGEEIELAPFEIMTLGALRKDWRRKR